MAESLRILILEDNPTDAELVQFELEDAGFVFAAKVVMTENAYVQAIQDYCPDLILSDYDLPTYNGALALVEARRRCPDTPFILVTGAVTEDRAIEILTQGAKDYVLKHRLQQRLVPAVRRALAEAEEQRARKKAEEELREAHRSLERQVAKRTADLQKEIEHRYRVEQSLLRYNERIEILSYTASRLLASDKPQQLVEELCLKVMEFLDCDAFFNFLVDEAAGRLHLNACAGIPKETMREIEWLDYGVAVCGCAARDACRIVAENIPITPDVRTELVKSFGIKAYACHPLMEQNRVMGTLSFGTRSRTTFSTDDLAMMKAVADQVAIAMSRVRAEDTMRESGTRFQSVLDNSRDVIYRLNVQTGCFEYISPSAETVIGFSPAELMAQDRETAIAMIHPDDIPAFRAALVRLEETGQEEVEYRQRTKTGNYRRISNHMSLIKDGAGRPLYRDGNIHDITERKRAEEAVSQSQKTFYELVERSPFGTYVVDSRFRIAQMNAASQTGAFRNVHPVIGRDFSEAMRILWPEPVAAEIIAAFRHTLDTGEPYYSPRFTNPRHDVATVESYEWELHHMTLPDGQYGVICYYFDSTRLREAERALRGSEEKYRNLVQQAPTGIYDVDFVTGRFTEVNDAMCQILGYTRDELLAMTAFNILDDEGKTRFASRIRRAQAGDQPDEVVEYQVRTKEGRLIWAILNTTFHWKGGRIVGATVVSHDITDRKRAEKELQQSEERYRTLFNGITEGFAIHEIVTDEHDTPVDYRFLDINPAFERLTGLKREDVVGKTHNELLPGDDPKWLRMYGTVALTGEPLRFENYSPALKRHYEVLAYRPVPRQFAVIFMDITERRQDDEAIQIMLQRFNALVSSIRSSILLVGEDGIELANQAFCDYFGLPESPPDLIGLTAGQLIEKIKRAYLRPEEEVTRIKEIIDLGQPVIGEEIAMQGGKTCLRDFIPISINGKLYGRLWNHTDITKRKQVEKALREKERLLQDVIDGSTSPIFLKDVDGKFITINASLERMLGMSREEIRGKTDYDIASEEVADYWQNHDEKVMETGKAIQIEEVADLQDGHHIFLANKFPLVDAEGQVYGVGAISHDITDRKHAETALKEQAKQLEDVNKDLESFSYSVSHDLRAPLRAITGYSQMILKKEGARFDEETRRRFQMITTNAETMGRLIDDLLAFSRLGSQVLAKSSLNMAELIGDAWQELVTIHPDRAMTLKIGKMPAACGDRALLRQVYSNLLGNAVKFTQGRNPAVIEAGSCVQDNETVYYVRDNGVGFDMKFYDKLFGVFQRLHSEEEYKGTGIGLALVKRIINRHGGRVWAEGEVDKGATFYFTLPTP